jgi:hypothetical protein
MAVHEPIHHAPKTLAEGAVCFGLALAALAGAAVALQWLMGVVA